MDKVTKWFNNIRQYESLSYGGLRTLNDIEKEYKELKNALETLKNETKRK